MILENTFNGVSMLSAMFSFIGGGAFRAIWAMVAGFVEKKQDHEHELQLAEFNAKQDAQRHSQEMERMKLASELGIKEIELKTDAEIELKEIESFTQGLTLLNQKTGVEWIDGWNGAIRPAYATFALMLWVLSVSQAGWILSAWTLDLIGSIAGFYFANRELGKQRK